jgi:prophage antirepressor-like protein
MEKITDWVVEEVLPSNRKIGQYSMNDEEKDRLLELNAQFLDMIKQKDK